MNLVFDIGYNKGSFSEKCLRHYPDCKVVGVEANIGLIYGHKEQKNLTVLHALVSSEDNKYVDFYIEPYQSGISTACKEFMENSRFTKGSKYLQPNSANWAHRAAVKTITLDTLVETYGSPDLIKIDVEGYEYEVMSGLSKKQNKISWEWHEEQYDTLLKTIEHLQSLGYEEFGMLGFFEEGDVFDKVDYSAEGDPYLAEPSQYYKWDDLEFERLVKEGRRVNYGMMFAK